MVDEWLLNELAVSFYVSLQCVSCELKFFTGYLAIAKETLNSLIHPSTHHNRKKEVKFYPFSSKYQLAPFAAREGSSPILNRIKEFGRSMRVTSIKAIFSSARQI